MEQQEKIMIPKVEYQGEDKKLMERVSKFKKGTARIVIFTLVGFVMGWFSINYIQDTFLPTKIILAIPYKISEAIYVTIIGMPGNQMWAYGHLDVLFFPQYAIATFLAERITPVLLAGAIYGSLAYFTGDKAVFTLQRFVKFAGIWCGVILLYIGGVYGINAKAMSDNEAFKDISGFFLYSEQKGEGFYEETKIGEKIIQSFYSELEQADNVKRNPQKEIPSEVYMASNTRNMVVWVNYEEQYIVTAGQKIFHISEEFADCVREYYENGTLKGYSSIKIEEKERTTEVDATSIE